MAVSYTHLDVYKRQIVPKPLMLNSKIKMKMNVRKLMILTMFIRMSLLMKIPEKSQNQRERIVLLTHQVMMQVITVSYTHLAEVKNKRSINQNNYLWALIHEITQHPNASSDDDWDMYLSLIHISFNKAEMSFFKKRYNLSATKMDMIFFSNQVS